MTGQPVFPLRVELVLHVRAVTNIEALQKAVTWLDGVYGTPSKDVETFTVRAIEWAKA